MSSFKKLSKSDVTVVPYSANKQWNLSYCPLPQNDANVVIYKGTNVTGSFNPETDPQTWDTYERLLYSQINHLFYQTYSSSLDTASLANSFNYESASQQRPTSSYFVYNDNPRLIKNFPTGSDSNYCYPTTFSGSIRVLAINQNTYGNKLLPYTFNLSSSVYNITDDGYGNLYDSSTHVGNIFYAHGLVVITNQDYQLMFPIPPLAYNDTVCFTANSTPKIVYPLLNDCGRTRTLLTGSLALSGSTTDLSYWTNNGNGTVTLTTTTPGKYVIYYTVQASTTGECAPIISNKAKITANVVAAECGFELFVTRI